MPLLLLMSINMRYTVSWFAVFTNFFEKLSAFVMVRKCEHGLYIKGRLIFCYILEDVNLAILGQNFFIS